MNEIHRDSLLTKRQLCSPARWRENEEQDVREDGHSLRIRNYMQFALAANENKPMDAFRSAVAAY